MKVAVISDSHGDINTLNKVFSGLRDIDKVIHLGDNFEDIIKVNSNYNKEIHYVSGNNDFGEGYNFLREKIINIRDKKIFLTHGHNYNVSRGVDRLYYKSKEMECDIVCFGHTHRRFYSLEDGIIFLNPGSITYPRDHNKGIALMDFLENDIRISFVDF